MHAAAETIAAEGYYADRRLAAILTEGDWSGLRAWVERALAYYNRHRPMALAAREAELSEDKPGDQLRTYLECIEPWVKTWPPTRRTEARMRFELCRLQMHHYMWGTSPELFSDEAPPAISSPRCGGPSSKNP
jgi:hypothetical protein